jgi:hypothetical protein
MTPRQEREKKEISPRIHDGSGTSQDKKRNEEETRHHPESHPQPHPAHHPQKQPLSTTPRHHPHTHPADHALNTDHGTHEDRPTPEKITKKGKLP